MAKYNAVLNFGGNRNEREMQGGVITESNAFTIRIELEANDYDEFGGQPGEGRITFHLLNGKGENIEQFIASHAEDTADGGIMIQLAGGEE